MSWGGDRPTKMVLLDIFPRVNWPLLSRVWCVGRGRVVLRGTPIERKRKEKDRHRFSHSFSKLTWYVS
jgi:hypothetical protein